MTKITFEADDVQIDAEIIAAGLGIDPASVQLLIREGKITSRHERGEGADAGRSRLTFFHGNRRFHLIVGADGDIVHRSAIDFGDVPLPAALRRPGG